MITNMGHVDPGYSGYLHFTAINMGNEPYGLKTSYDYRCCTMILFKLSEDVEPYRKGQIIKFSTNRGEIEVSDAVDNSLPYLAKDFLSIEKRAESVAEKKFNKTAWASGIFSFMAALIVAAYPLYQTYINKPWETESNKVNNKMQVLETKLDYEKRIIELEKKLDYENRVIEIEKKVNELTKKGKS